MRVPILVDEGRILLDPDRIMAVHLLSEGRLKVDMEGGFVITLTATTMGQLVDKLADSYGENFTNDLTIAMVTGSSGSGVKR